MQLQYQEQPKETQERTYDLETIGKVTRLAERMQSREKDTWTAEEVEAMGAEVGLKPEFIREALGKVEEERKVAPPKPKRKANPKDLRAWRNAWWAGGWMAAPLGLFAIANVLGMSEVVQGLGLFLGVPVYVGLGAYLTSLARNAVEATSPPFSREDMLRTLEQYRATNEPRELTVLSVGPAVALSPEELANLQQWIRASCRTYRSDGELTCGASLEITFRSAEDAASAARALQDALTSQAALEGAKSSGRLKCGLATGFEFDRVRQQASALQQAAMADDILVDRHTAGGALPALDHLTELPGEVAGGRSSPGGLRAQPEAARAVNQLRHPHPTRNFMLLHQQTEETGLNAAAELRLDRDTAEKVTALALRLQEKRGGTLSVRELEEAGKEVGLEPQFVHEALAQVRQSQRPQSESTSHWQKWGRVIHPAWWAAGWALPISLAAGGDALGIPGGMIGAVFMGTMGIYVGGGVVLSMLFGDEASKPLTAEEQEALIRSIGRWTTPAAVAPPPVTASPPVAATIARLMAPEGGAHLHIVPRLEAGTATDFAVWALSLVRQEGGELLSATAEAIECRFATPNAAIRAARRLQEEGQGLLACGVAPASTGSRHLAVNATSGDVVIDESYAAEGLRELGRLARLEYGGRGALSWKAGRDG